MTHGNDKEPAHSTAGHYAQALVDRLKTKPFPSATDLDRLLAHAIALPRVDYAKQVRDQLTVWRGAGNESCDLCMGEALLTVGVPALSASHRLLARGGRCDTRCESLEVINNFHHGHLTEAITLAERNDWFRGKLEEAAGVSHALLALALTERCEEAWSIIEGWKDHFAQNLPEKYQMMLRVEAEVAAYTQRYAKALALLEDAHALCDEYGWELARANTEPALAVAYARTDELGRAHEIMDSWDDSAGQEEAGDEASCLGPLSGARELTRMQIALLEERFAEVTRHADRAGTYAEAIHSAPLLCHIHFHRVLAADKDAFPEELRVFRHLVHRYQIPYYLRRLNMLQQLVPRGESARSVQVIVRTRQGCEPYPLLRLWMPKVEDVGANIYYDRIQGMLYIAGTGPFFFKDQLIFKLLDAIVAKPEFSIPVPDLFSEVWGTEYRHLDHEGKFHVTVHRLRGWLDEHGPGDCRSMVLIQDSAASLCKDADVRAVELRGPCGGRVAEEALSDRLLDLLAEHSPSSPREMEAHLGVSRSTLNEVVRRLMDQGRVSRSGRGPATRYKLTY